MGAGEGFLVWVTRSLKLSKLQRPAPRRMREWEAHMASIALILLLFLDDLTRVTPIVTPEGVAMSALSQFPMRS